MQNTHRPAFTTLLFALVLTLLFSGRNALAEEDEQLTLNFANTDITQVINAVAKLTGKNFIVDPRVKGKVTVITHHAMSRDEVYQVFISLLKVHGFATIPGTNVIKIVPEVNAKQDSIQTTTHATRKDGDQMVTQVIQIKYVNAAQLVPILRPLVPQRGHLAAYTQSNVLIISDSGANIARLLQIIHRIDQAVNDEVEVIKLEHATASEIVKIIKQLQKPGAKDAASKYLMVADDRTNSILLGGDKQKRLRMRALILHLDTPLDVGGDTTVIYLKYAKSKDLVNVLTGISKTLTGKGRVKKAPSPRGVQNNVNILADEASNALIINAPPAILRKLRRVVSQLDIRRQQVLVEAVIAEVSYEKSSELGVEWVLDGTAGGSKTGPVGVLNFGNLPGLLTDPPTVGTGLSFGLGSFSNGVPEFGMLVRALAGDANSNVLATPSLMTMDNEEATIVVAQTVPFVTGQYANTGGGTTPQNPFQTIQREDVGLTLKIKPQINEGDAIRLEIDQEVSALSDSSIGVNVITKKRSWTTTVMVEDDQILVVGGLIDEALTEATQKIPGLGDIPVLGWMFKTKRMKKIKTNLMAFIHPVIIKNKAILNKHTGRKYNYLRGKELEMSQKGISLFSDQEIPIMPEYQPVPDLPPRYTPKGGGHSEIPEPPQDPLD